MTGGEKGIHKNAAGEHEGDGRVECERNALITLQKVIFMSKEDARYVCIDRGRRCAVVILSRGISARLNISSGKGNYVILRSSKQLPVTAYSKQLCFCLKIYIDIKII